MCQAIISYFFRAGSQGRSPRTLLAAVWPASRPAPAGFCAFAFAPFPLMCSASSGTAPEPSRAHRGGGRNLPAFGRFLQPRTLDGEDPFRILVAQGKGASNSLLPQADSFPAAFHASFAEPFPMSSRFAFPLNLSWPPGFHTHSFADSPGVRCRLVFD